MDQNIQKFIDGKRVAVVGVSRSGKKFGNTIATELKQRGYQVSIIHSEAGEINGEPCFPNLASVAGKVDGVVVCVPPSAAVQVVQDAGQAGIKNIWLQQGAQSNAAIEAARGFGITPVNGKCILMYAGQVKSIHAFHRGFAKLFGQY